MRGGGVADFYYRLGEYPQFKTFHGWYDDPDWVHALAFGADILHLSTHPHYPSIGIDSYEEDGEWFSNVYWNEDGNVTSGAG